MSTGTRTKLISLPADAEGIRWEEWRWRELGNLWAAVAKEKGHRFYRKREWDAWTTAHLEYVTRSRMGTDQQE